MATTVTFTTDDAFPVARIDLADRRFMSRLDREAWDTQVQALIVEIEQHGLLAPVGVARLAGESRYLVVYGFTRSAAVSRLGWPTIRANIYEGLDETTARFLNAGDNAWHTPLTDWERAQQLRKLREIGIPVESANGEPCLTRLFGMPRRTVFNWLRIVGYNSPALHQAIADKQLGLQHALVFQEYPPDVTEAWIARCIHGEWSSRELRRRLIAATDEPVAPPLRTTDDRAMLHAGISSHPTPTRCPWKADPVARLPRALHPLGRGGI